MRLQTFLCMYLTERNLSKSHRGDCTNVYAVGVSLHCCTFSRWATAPSLEALMEPSQIDPARDKAKHMKQVGAWR